VKVESTGWDAPYTDGDPVTWSVPKTEAWTPFAVERLLDGSLYDLLDRISPRQWRSGVAAWWVMVHLTYADAITRDSLSAIPQASYGHSVADAEQFAEALPQKYVVRRNSKYGWCVINTETHDTEFFGVQEDTAYERATALNSETA